MLELLKIDISASAGFRRFTFGEVVGTLAAMLLVAAMSKIAATKKLGVENFILNIP